jgi:hypothetical protein
MVAFSSCSSCPIEISDGKSVIQLDSPELVIRVRGETVTVEHPLKLGHFDLISHPVAPFPIVAILTLLLTNAPVEVLPQPSLPASAAASL